MTHPLAAAMPAMLRHEGLWRGVYRHLDADGQLTDRHRAEVRCEFPRDGPHAYFQHNHFTWDDGRETRATLRGVLREGKLWWDEPTFAGCAWESEGLILLDLERRDDPGARFFEIIVLGEDGTRRARTWHWFKHGALFRRTLRDEMRVA